MQGGTYPIVIADACGEVSGAIVGGLSARDVARLAAYEGPGYRVVPLRVKVRGRMTVVTVFEPIQSRLKPSRELWNLRLWQRRHKRLFVERLKRALSGRPAYSRP